MILKKVNKVIDLNKVRESKKKKKKGNYMDMVMQVVKAKDENIKRIVLNNTRNMYIHNPLVVDATLKIEYKEEYGAQKIDDLINRLQIEKAPMWIILNAGNKAHEITFRLVDVMKIKGYPVVLRYMIM